MNNVRHSSENSAFMSPVWLVEIGRYVLGGIDTDPASSEFANQVVKAPKIYTAEDNGLLAPRWEGRVFLNPPGGIVDKHGRRVIHARTIKGVRYPGCTETGECGLPAPHKHEGEMSSAVLFWRVLCKQWERGHVAAAFFVGFSLELLQSCQGGPDPGHHPLDFYCCVPRERIKFDAVVDGERVPGNQPTHSNVLVLLPFRDHVLNAQSRSRFEEALAPVGYIHRGNGMYG
jgi:hypothetical protein